MLMKQSQVAACGMVLHYLPCCKLCRTEQPAPTLQACHFVPNLQALLLSDTISPFRKNFMTLVLLSIAGRVLAADMELPLTVPCRALSLHCLPCLRMPPCP